MAQDAQPGYAGGAENSLGFLPQGKEPLVAFAQGTWRLGLLQNQACPACCQLTLSCSQASCDHRPALPGATCQAQTAPPRCPPGLCPCQAPTAAPAATANCHPISFQGPPPS